MKWIWGDILKFEWTQPKIYENHDHNYNEQSEILLGQSHGVM